MYRNIDVNCAYEKCKKTISIDIGSCEEYKLYFCNSQCELWNSGIGFFILGKIFWLLAVFFSIVAVCCLFGTLSLLPLNALLQYCEQFLK